MPARVPEITVSDAALKHIESYLHLDSSSRGLRLSITRTGCSGYAYQVESVAGWDAEDWILPLTEKYNLCIDDKSYFLLKGIHIDYVKQGLNGKLIYSNPNQKGQCGCGESFTV